MKVLFMGTPVFAVPSLQALLESRHQVVGVVTRPDRPAGRGLHLQPPPVKEVAREHGLTVIQPTRIKHPAFAESIRSFEPDVLVVVAFGRILPPAVLDAAPHGAVNLHASLLPSYRGAAPAAWAIARGETVTGISTMRIVEELDAGDVYMQRSLPIGPGETTGELEVRLAELGAPYLVETLDALESGEMAGLPQDSSLATYAPIISKKDGEIDWSTRSEEIACRVRAFDPWPVAFTSHDGRLLRIRKARVDETDPAGAATEAAMIEAGTLVEASRHRVVVVCGEGTRLELLEVQPEGRRRMEATQAVAGRQLKEGARLG